MSPMASLTPHSFAMINYPIGMICCAVHIYADVCYIYAVYGSVCGASVLLISTAVGVVCVFVCIKHKYNGSVSVYWYCIK